MKNLGRYIFTGLFIIVFVAYISAQNQTVNYYIYDDNGRLQAVIHPTGNVSIYEYDAAGNFISIRIAGSDTLEFISFNPRSGLPGNRVNLYGVGFNNVNSVLFNGISANIVSFTNNIIVVEVPVNATSGLITVNTPPGTVNSVSPFLVQGIMIDPPNLTIQEGQTQQFTAQVTIPGDNEDIQWSVNGIVGGDTFNGTITTNGLYTAPNEIESSINVVVKATSIKFPLISGEARVHVQSVNDLRFNYSGAVSIGKGDGIGPISKPVSIGKGQGIGEISQPVSVSKGEGFGRVAYSSPVSIAKAPVITSISPINFQRNTTTTITITGNNLLGVNSIIFINGSSIDTTLSVSNINVNAQGTTLTTTLTVGNSGTGQRFVIVATPNTRSTTVNLGINAINIVQ